MSKKDIVILSMILGIIISVFSIAIFIPYEEQYNRHEYQDCFSYRDSITLDIVTICEKKDSIACEKYFLNHLDNLSYCYLPNLEVELNFFIDSIGIEENSIIDVYKERLTINSLSSYPFDSTKIEFAYLMDKLVFGERAKLLGENNSRYRYFYLDIGDFWMNKVALHLTYLNEINSNLKFTQEFKILQERCSQNKYHLAIEYTYSEKIANYLIQQRFVYIAKRVWYGTGVWSKIAIFIVLVTSLVAYYLLINFVIQSIKKKKKQ